MHSKKKTDSSSDTMQPHEKLGLITGLMQTAFAAVATIDKSALTAKQKQGLDIAIMNALEDEPPCEFDELADVVAELGSRKHAIALYKNILVLSPELFYPRLSLAELYRVDGQQAEALHILKPMLEETGTDKEPQNKELRMTVLDALADTYKSQGDNISEWNTVLSMSFINSENSTNIVNLRSREVRDRAREGNKTEKADINNRLCNIRRRMDRAGQTYARRYGG